MKKLIAITALILALDISASAASAEPLPGTTYRVDEHGYLVKENSPPLLTGCVLSTYYYAPPLPLPARTSTGRAPSGLVEVGKRRRRHDRKG